jgi:hypothetical protein
MHPTEYESRVCGRNVAALERLRRGWVPVTATGMVAMPAESAASVRLCGPLVAGVPSWGYQYGTFERGSQQATFDRGTAKVTECAKHAIERSMAALGTQADTDTSRSLTKPSPDVVMHPSRRDLVNSRPPSVSAAERSLEAAVHGHGRTMGDEAADLPVPGDDRFEGGCAADVGGGT